MDDTRTRFPESHVVLWVGIDGGPYQKRLRANTCITKSYLRSGRSQKVVDLLVDVDCALKIGDTTNLSLDQVVAVDGGGDSGSIHSGRHELQDSHLDRTSGTNTSGG